MTNKEKKSLYEKIMRNVSVQVKKALNESENTMWRNVPGTQFIWHGEWSDPEIKFEGYTLNEPDANEFLWNAFEDACEDEWERDQYRKNTGKTLVNTEECFNEWLDYQGTDWVQSILRDMINGLRESGEALPDVTYYCPECGHEFVQGEYDYNYDTAFLDFDCPECGWSGNENMVDTDEDVDEL